MARMARVVVPDYPHHVTQRGNHHHRKHFSVTMITSITLS